jgi:hypothetical protein
VQQDQQGQVLLMRVVPWFLAALGVGFCSRLSACALWDLSEGNGWQVWQGMSVGFQLLAVMPSRRRTAGCLAGFGRCWLSVG